MNSGLQIQILCVILIYLSVIALNIVRKNSLIVATYMWQSIMLSIILIAHVTADYSVGLVIVTLLVISIKVIGGPLLLFRFIRRGDVNDTALAYLNIPYTLLVLLALSIFAQSDTFAPLSSYIHQSSQLWLMLFGSILMSIFFIINRKGIISQIIGVLSLENSIYTFSLFLGNRQRASLEMGILFDVLFWIMIAYALLTLVFRHYKSMDVTKLSRLR